jgi:CRP-like cAMP-binding protein
MNNDMETQIKIISLAKCLHGFGLVDLKQLLSVSSKARWRAGEDVFFEGDSGRNMYIICAGKISIWRRSAGQCLSLASLSVGESFGEMALVDAGKRSAGAKAVEDTLALCISYDRLHEAPAAASILFRNIARALAERLTIANNVIVFQSQTGAELPPLDTIGKNRRAKKSV